MGLHKKWRFGVQIESPAPGSPLLPSASPVPGLPLPPPAPHALRRPPWRHKDSWQPAARHLAGTPFQIEHSQAARQQAQPMSCYRPTPNGTAQFHLQPSGWFLRATLGLQPFGLR